MVGYAFAWLVLYVILKGLERGMGSPESPTK